MDMLHIINLKVDDLIPHPRWLNSRQISSHSQTFVQILMFKIFSSIVHKIEVET